MEIPVRIWKGALWLIKAYKGFLYIKIKLLSMIRISILLIVIILSGCSTVNRIIDTYRDLPVRIVGFRVKSTEENKIIWAVILEFNFGTNYNKRPIKIINLERYDYDYYDYYDYDYARRSYLH